MPADGTAAAATKLSLARKINGVAFDGTTNITITAEANGGTATTTIGNAGTATKLATARKINGVPFDGTADINLTPQNLGFGEGLLAENGYQKLPGGLIIQWGVANENLTNVFPIPFPSQCFMLNTTCRRNGAPWDGSVTTAYIISNSEFFVGVGQKTGDLMYWFAIGY